MKRTKKGERERESEKGYEIIHCKILILIEKNAWN